MKFGCNFAVLIAVRRLSVAMLAVSITASAALSSRPVYAQSSSDDGRARMHFESGRLHFEVGEYDAALSEFRAAYELSHRPALLLNMANAQERLGLLTDAIESLRTYLSSTTDAEERSRIERRVQNLEARALGSSAGATPAPSDESGDVVASDPLASNPSVDEPESRSRHLAPALIGYGVGAAGFVTLAVAGSLALSRDRALADGCGATGTCTSSEIAVADRRALIADIGLGVGIVGAAAGTILLLVRPSRSDATAAFFVVPRVARDEAGASAVVRF